ncbi:hypothetical protein [Agromyces allii]|uniref:Uncharacterized protein n=1 Tax=Agromyces allii TaxID=393607 RepID=A0ABN2QEI7_9MICO|nr:hypothetical protein [Agromyces allii]
MTVTRPPRPQRRIHDVVQAAQGGRRVALGALAAATVIVGGHFVEAVTLYDRFPAGPGPWPAWVAFSAVFALVAVTAVRVDGRIPDWVLVIVMVGLCSAAALDVQATWGLLGAHAHPTVAPACGALLMVVAAQRPVTGPIVAASLIAAAQIAAALTETETAGLEMFTGLGSAGATILPVVLATVAVRGFRTIVDHELALARARKTAITGPLVDAGEVEAIARLDRDAEQVLDQVAWGEYLDAATSARAEEVGSALRRRLIEGRNETWLKYAVEQSDYLSEFVTVNDEGAHATQLDHDQRDGLLVGLWLLRGHARQAERVPFEINVTVLEHAEKSVSIRIDVAGIQVRDVDQTAWDSFQLVGPVATTADDAGFEMRIADPAAADAGAGARGLHRADRHRADQHRTDHHRADQHRADHAPRPQRREHAGEHPQ